MIWNVLSIAESSLRCHQHIMSDYQILVFCHVHCSQSEVAGEGQETLKEIGPKLCVMNKIFYEAIVFSIFRKNGQSVA